jgi:hypothetical protein
MTWPLLSFPGLLNAIRSVTILALIAGVAVCFANTANGDDASFPKRIVHAGLGESSVRPVSIFSRPVLRIVVDDGNRFDLDDSKLRTIDGAERELPVVSFGKHRPQRKKQKTVLAELFRTPDFSAWISREQTDSRQAQYSLSDIDNSAIQPVKRISIPNPLRLLGNPLRWTGRFRGEVGDNFDDTNHIRGNLIVNSGLPIGFDTEVVYRHDEKMRRGTNDLLTGDFNLIYRFGKVRNAEIRAGIGVNWLTGGDSTELGFNSTYGVDIYLARPWIISTSFDWGTLGSQELLHARITGGLDLGRFEIFFGYDFYEIGNQERKGWVAGLGMWF